MEQSGKERMVGDIKWRIKISLGQEGDVIRSKW